MRQLRIVFAIAGFVAALLGVIFDDRRLGWVAIGFLTLSLILRVILRKRENHPSGTDREV